jgi:hypothetical protein
MARRILEERRSQMPGLNGTGPNGMGPMTGWGRGTCHPSRVIAGRRMSGSPGYARGYGRGPGYGRGHGFGRGRRYCRGADIPAEKWYEPAYPPVDDGAYPMRPEDEIGILKNQAETIKNELDMINKRIETLEGTSSE